MATVDWVEDGSTDIRPDADKGLLPYTSATNKNIGSSSRRWGATWIGALDSVGNASFDGNADFVLADGELFTVTTDDFEDLVKVIGTSNKVAIGGVSGSATDGRLRVVQFDDEDSIAVLELVQTSDDGPILKIQGNVQSDFSGNISTDPGNGVFIAPLSAIGPGATGWQFLCMVKCLINGVGEAWLALYGPVTNPS
ncbi:MAG: hypothetical protein HRF49_07895 [bacterium]|jgi:hypothetical protein